MVKYDSFSSNAKFKNILDSQIKQEDGFKEAKEAMLRLEKQGDLNSSLDKSEVEGLSEVVEYGDFGKLKNEILVTEAELYDPHSKYSEEEKARIEQELKEKKKKGIAMQENFKNKAREKLKQNPNYKSVKERCKTLNEIVKNNPPESDAYKSATEELRQIAIDHKEIFMLEHKISKANDEIRDLKKTHAFAPSLETNDVQMGA